MGDFIVRVVIAAVFIAVAYYVGKLHGRTEKPRKVAKMSITYEVDGQSRTDVTEYTEDGLAVLNALAEQRNLPDSVAPKC